MFSFGFYNSKNQDRMYNAMHLGKIFDGVIQDGVFGTIHETNKIGFQLEPTNPVSRSAKINKGKAWFAHTWNLLDSSANLSFGAVTTPNGKRTDAVCIEVNNSYNASGFTPRTNSLIVVQGSEVLADGPNVKPTLAQYQQKNSAGEVIIWRYPIAYVTIYQSDYPSSGTGAVSQYHADVVEEVNIESAINPVGALSDEKYKTWTPFVTGATLDITDYIPSTADFEAAFNTMLNNDQADFNEWFRLISGSYVGDYVEFSGSVFQANVVYYELINSKYIPTSDSSPQVGKTYYQFNNAASIEALDTKIDNKIIYGTTEPTPSMLEANQVYFMIEE